jgi:tRNA(Ile)-lysidine synthase
VLAKFKKVNKKHLNKKLLVAVSGGVDSMVLLDLLLKCKTLLEVAYVDHNTRAGQSTKDGNFVKDFCKKNNIPFHQKKFKHTDGNFQSEARIFRKNFFNQLLEDQNLDLIVTGHHMDDVIEGFLLASFRGTHQNRIITPKHLEYNYFRPLYVFDKEEILQYAEQNSVPFVQDASNYENNYTRNYYRNNILPQIYGLIPQGKSGIKKTIQKLTKDISLLGRLIELHLPNFLVKSPGHTILDLQYLDEKKLFGILPHVLAEFSFTEDQLTKIRTSNTGALFYTVDHIAVKDRGKLIIHPKEKVRDVPQMINEPGVYRFGKYNLAIDQIVNDRSDRNLANEIFISLGPKDFPLEIRLLQPGDKIKPKRLKGKSTKIAKALTDLKIDLFSKNSTLIIKTSEHILWAYPYLKGSKLDVNPSRKWYKIKITIED